MYRLFPLLAVLLAACQPQSNNLPPAASTASAPAAQPTITAAASLSWQDCQQEQFSHWFAEDIPKGLQCAHLSVPLDYKQPESKRIRLALTRLPAASHSIGNLLIIAGGPGENSIEFLANSFDRNKHTTPLTEHFDLIGFAPRGIAPSEPEITCGSNLHQWKDNVKGLIDTCVKLSGSDLLRHISTEDAVSDIESIRLALGGSRLNAIGYSYGTKVLSRYTQRYGQHLRAAVFDGVIDTTQDLFAALHSQEKGFQSTFERFAADCRKHSDCLFDGQSDINSQFHRFLNEAEQRKLHDIRKQPIGADEILGVIQDNLLWPDNWADIRTLMRDIRAGRTHAYNTLVYGEDFDPQEEVSEDAALFAINCADSAPQQRNAATYAAKMKQIDALSPYDNYKTKTEQDYLDECFYWPHAGNEQRSRPQPPNGTPPLLFIAQKFDPTTPHSDAENMAALFRAPLITRKGDGHTLALSGESACVDRQTAAYLFNPQNKIESHTCHD